jgi:hypothetical protein
MRVVMDVPAPQRRAVAEAGRRRVVERCGRAAVVAAWQDVVLEAIGRTSPPGRA